VANPAKVVRERVVSLEDLPNIGKACAADLRQLGILEPAQLRGQDPVALYDALADLTGQRHDPCMLDVLLSVVRFMEGGLSLPWWSYTEERKALLRARRKP
jgi:hypothetical protein